MTYSITAAVLQRELTVNTDTPGQHGVQPANNVNHQRHASVARDSVNISHNVNDRSHSTKPHKLKLEMWPNAQRDGRPAEYRWRPLFNAANFG